MLSTWTRIAPVILPGNCPTQSINLIMEILQETEFPKSLSELSNRQGFDPKPDKRLFIYRIADEAYIRPLWLGSRVAQPLEDFRIIREETPTRIRTLERERSGNFLVAEYIWRGFGLDFKRYLKREVKKQEAIHILKH